MPSKPISLLIEGARVIDPSSGFDQMANIAIAEGKILSVGEPPSDFAPQHTIKAHGLVLAPGLVDLCARVGGESNVAQELKAAASGGITTLVCPPDTAPILDEPGNVEMLLLKAEQQAIVSRCPQPRLFPLGALMKGLVGKELSELSHLYQAGCIAFSHGDTPIADTQNLHRSMQYAASFGFHVWIHPRDAHLGAGGVAASGAVATRLGLSGIPVAAETVALFTLFELVRATNCRLHISRLSSASSVSLVKAAKAEGLPISCDVSINNLLLTDIDIGYFDSRFRLTPVLRSPRDRDALQAGLIDGTIDAIVSDHAPVSADNKLLPFALSEPGASGVELLLPLLLSFGKAKGLGLKESLAYVTSRASACLPQRLPPIHTTPSDGKHSSLISVGAPANLIIFDPNKTWTVSTELFASVSNCSPWLGYEMLGKVVTTVIDGQIITT